MQQDCTGRAGNELLAAYNTRLMSTGRISAATARTFCRRLILRLLSWLKLGIINGETILPRRSLSGASKYWSVRMTSPFVRPVITGRLIAQGRFRDIKTDRFWWRWKILRRPKNAEDGSFRIRSSEIKMRFLIMDRDSVVTLFTSTVPTDTIGTICQ